MGNRLFDDKDKRRFDRKQLVYYLKILHNDSGRIAGYLGDLSVRGLMLFSKEKIDTRKVFCLRINEDGDLGIREPMIFNARSLWVDKDVNPEYHAIGFEFLDLDQTGLDQIKDLITAYGFGN